MFKNPIAPKEKKKEQDSPWNYDQPPYDQRTSCYVSAGTDYGTGYKVPVGHEGKTSVDIPTLPRKAQRIDLQEYEDKIEIVE